MKTKLEELLDKYEQRVIECDEQFAEDVASLKTCSDNSRVEWLNNDIRSLNTQLGVYECIIKDIEELIDEVSR